MPTPFPDPRRHPAAAITARYAQTAGQDHLGALAGFDGDVAFDCAHGAVHIDRLFLATAATAIPDSTPGHHARWFTAAETAETDGISPDSQIQDAALFSWLAAHSRRTPPTPGTCDWPQLPAGCHG